MKKFAGQDIEIIICGDETSEELLGIYQSNWIDEKIVIFPSIDGPKTIKID
jgi:hypothetical protein